MKTVMYRHKNRILYGMVVLLAMVCILVSAYVLATKHKIPACRAITKAVNYTQEGKIETSLLVSLVPTGWKKLNIILNGQVKQGTEKYTVSRMLITEYQYQSDYYHIKVQQAVRHPRDNVRGEEANRVMPGMGKDFFIKIERIDESSFMFSENNSPLFICTKTN